MFYKIKNWNIKRRARKLSKLIRQKKELLPYIKKYNKINKKIEKLEKIWK